MSAELTILVVLAAVSVMFWLIFVVLPYVIDHPAGPHGAVPADETVERLDHCHHAPTGPYTVAQAQRIMQRLIDCDATACDAKAAAFRVLAEAGMVKPAKDLR
ncbi:hypothetical protein [Nocardia amamiensis]|uniref:hypothetical protein n=1 Tax=Nocardia amamiensis TaxID=404578 RepID=UPI00082B3448|nr:hypothetical protein [Nocardia amamiensis]